MKGPLVGILIVIPLGLLPACEAVQLKGGPAGTRPEAEASAADWPFIPVRMRVHPFTALRYDAEAKTPVLEARVELLDRMGDPAKGVGEFRFELYRLPRRAAPALEDSRLLYRWQSPVTTLEQNHRHWDPITRSYVFRLKMRQVPEPGTRLLVRADFVAAGDRRLQAEADLVVPDAIDGDGS